MPTADPRQYRVALVGLGKLGSSVAAGLAGRRDIRIVSAVDPDPEKVGVPLGEVVGTGQTDVIVTATLPTGVEVDVAVIMTSSYLHDVKATLEACARRGVNVLTSAEELAYPYRDFPAESRELDGIARANAVTILSAGANPGYLMDALPVAMTLASQEIVKISVTRTLDLRPQRFHRAGRFGIALTPEDFARRSDLKGHSGFEQSIAATADALGWTLEDVDVTSVAPVVVARGTRSGAHFDIEPGQIAVVEQRATGRVAGRTAIELTEYFGFMDPDDEVVHGDTYLIEGTDQTFQVVISPGVLSYVTTPAVLVNLVSVTVEAAPGLVTSLDLAVRQFASKGALRTNGGVTG